MMMPGTVKSGRMARWCAAVFTIAAVAASVAVPRPADAAGPQPPFIPANAGWLQSVNYYRAMSGLGPVTENPSWSAGDRNHACYMLLNDIVHDEIPGRPGYTASGDAAGNASNVAVSSVAGELERDFIELWMTGPFHAIGILRPGLRTVGYGQCDNPSAARWHSGAALDVIRGLVAVPKPTAPILFPGNGATTSLSSFQAETPNPLTFCGYADSAGLPLIAMMPEKTTSATATLTGPSGPAEVCSLASGNTSGDAAAILGGENAVVVVPRQPLLPGVYQASVTTAARTVTWSFRVDPQAALGQPAVPAVTPIGGAGRLTTVTPFRFADSRVASRITPLLGGVPKRIHVGGVAGGVPAGSTAISANFTVTQPAAGGYLTIYNCATIAPTVSTLNFAPGETVANGGLFPLSAEGDICVYSPAGTQLLIDINGYTGPAGTLGYVPTANRMLIDQTVAAEETFTVPVGAAGVSAVAVTVTASNTTSRGYVTLYDCDQARPTVSALNQDAGVVKQNFVIVPVPMSGVLCGYSSSATQVRVDLAGTFAAGGKVFNATNPTRLVDTRDLYRPEMNLGTGGGRVAGGVVSQVQIGGQRGIPAGVSAVSVNVTAAGSVTAGSITVWDCGAARGVATVTFPAGKAVADGALIDLSAGGALCVSSTVATNVIVDITGWWS